MAKKKKAKAKAKSGKTGGGKGASIGVKKVMSKAQSPKRTAGAAYKTKAGR